MNPAAAPQVSRAPLGVFDSGLGGLTVVRALLREMPGESIVYIGDTAHVPYGPRPAAEIRDFSLAIGRYLIETAGCRAIVVACNTATAAGVDALRTAYPSVPIIGMEPGVKPAVAQTRTGRIAVLATASTLSADRFAGLVKRFGGDVTVVTQPCPGWVEAVERGELDSPATYALVERYVAPLVASGVDTLVLGCTHYPLLRPLIEQAASSIAGVGVGIVDTGPAVARHVARVVDLTPLPPLRPGEGEYRRVLPLPYAIAEDAPTLRLPLSGTERGQGGEVLLLTTAPSQSFHALPTVRAILADVPSTTAIQFGSVFWKNGELTDDGDSAS